MERLSSALVMSVKCLGYEVIKCRVESAIKSALNNITLEPVNVDT